MAPSSPRAALAWARLDELTDPEIPVVTLREMGIVREVHDTGAGVRVVITPTYSGCPAMDQIEADIRAALAQAGLQAEVVTRLAPAWTTDWMTPAAHDKLRAYGIAPPQGRCTGEAEAAAGPASAVLRFMRPRGSASESIACPRCGSIQTTQTSHFGSTACKALYRCLACLEPFDYFKQI